MRKVQSLESPETIPKSNPSEIPLDFFSLYSALPAFSKNLTRPNQAVELFSASKAKLEKELERHLEQRENISATPNLAICHALLALIYWLYPNYEQFDRMKNAMEMYHNAKEAARYATPFTESYVLGLFIQLRVLPFLIMSNKPYENHLSKIQGKAQLLILTLDSAARDDPSEESENHEKGKMNDSGARDLDSRQIELFRGLLHEALGFSYWQLKRDYESAVKHLQKSISMLVGPEAVQPAMNVEGDLFQGTPLTRRKAHSSKLESSGSRAFFSAFGAIAFWDIGHCHEGLSESREGDESIRLIKNARANYEKSYALAKKTRWDIYKGLSAYMIASALEIESQQEDDKERKLKLLKQAITIGEEALRWISRWSIYDSEFLAGSWIAAIYGQMADHAEPKLKRSYLLHSLKLARRAEDLILKHESKSGGKLLSASRIGDIYLRNSTLYRQLALYEKTSATGYLTVEGSAKGEKSRESEGKRYAVDALKKSLEYAIRSKRYYKEDRSGWRTLESCKLASKVCYELLKIDSLEEEKKKLLAIARKACGDAATIAVKHDWKEKVAESSWDAALIFDVQGEYRESAKYYLKAYEFYERAKLAYEHGSRVYQDFTDYMQGWSKIELAKLAHASSEFEKASELYGQAAKFVSKTKNWSKAGPLFVAESLIEKGEGRALQEEEKAAENAIGFFDEAILNLSKISDESKKKDEDKITEQLDLIPLAKQLTLFCRARIILEKSKDAYRLGDYERSIGGLSNAESMFDELATNPIISDPLRSNELHSMASLCKALGSFQKAQVKGDYELYLEARKIFGKAAEESKSKTLRPLLTGLASFASFLFYSKQVEESLDTKVDFEQLNECNKALQNAESNFRRLGNKSFLNMLKASKHILDATIKMSAAEREVERMDVKSELYADAQKSLALASKYYKSMGSSKRLKEALKMVSAVRSHQRLIPLAHDIIAEVASSQIIYAAIASSPVMEQTPYASTPSGALYVSLDCELEKAYTQAGVKSSISFSVSNLGRDSIILVRIDEVIPEGFVVAECPAGSVSGSNLKLNLRLEAGATRSFSLTYEPREAGEFNWHPSLIFLDAMKNYRIARARAARSIVEPNDQEDFAVLLQSKARLDDELKTLRSRKLEIEEKAKSDSNASSEEPKLQEEIYRVKEELSKIEEKFLRTKNEYNSLMTEQEKVRLDIESIAGRSDTQTSEPEISDEYTNLKAEDKLLEARINRRRSLLEQAQLL